MKGRYALPVLLVVFAVVAAGSVVTGCLFHWGVPVPAVVRAAPHSLWLLAAKNDNAEVHALVRPQFRMTILFIGSLLVGTAVVVGWLWRQRRLKPYRNHDEAEDKYRAICEASTDGIVIADVQTRKFQYANPVFCRMFGYAEKELTALGVAELHPQDALQHVQAEFESQARGEKTFSPNLPCLRKDGSTFRANVNAVRVTLAGRHYLVGVFHDTTDRRQAEKALWESDARYRALVDNTVLGIAVMDTDYRIIMVNPTFAGLFKKPAADFVGKHCFEEFEKRDRVCPHCPGRRAMASGKTEEVETEGVRDDGSRFWVHNRAAPFFAPEGTLTGFVEMVEDIDERKQGAEALRKSDDRYRTSIELTQQLAWTTDAEGMVVEDIPHWRKFTGQSCEEVKNDGWKKALHPDDVERAAQAWKKAVDTKSAYEVEYRVRRSDGVYRDFLTRGVPVLASDGNIREWIGVCIDITQRKQAEEALQAANAQLQQTVVRAEALAVCAEAANRAKSEFLANMSHEIRTPMTAILGFSDLLATPDLPQNERREYLEGIQKNGKALLRLIGNILDLSKIEADKLTLEKVACSLQQIIDDVTSATRVGAEQKGLGLNVHYEFPLPATLCTDPVRLQQILINLLGNAVKFSQQGDVCLTIRSLHEADGRVRMEFAVSDSGIGIPADKIGGLFQPFTQVDASATRLYGGTGLGLAISKRLAKALGGDIGVASELGKGSTFTLTIDWGPSDGVQMLESPQSMVVEDAESPNTAELLLHGRLLLAEDDPSLQRIISLLLRKMNLEVTVADNGRMVCELAEKSKAAGSPYDLILMDIQMPKMNGYEATRWLRLHGWQGLIVALTAHAMIGDRNECLAAGCDDYIAKPVTLAGLQTVLARYLSQKAVSAKAVSEKEQAASP